MRFVARRSGPNTAAHVRAAASASTFGGDIRYHNDFADPVHVRCREPSTRTEPGTHVAETRSAERESRLSELLDPTRRTMLVAPDNRCFGAFWCVHSDQAGLLAFAVVVHSAGVADCDRGPTDSDGARAGVCCSAAQRLRRWMLPGGRKGPASSSAVPPCPLVSSERIGERRDG